VLSTFTKAQPQPPDWAIKDEALRAYFEAETQAIHKRTLAELAAIKSPADWKTAKERLRGELADMLGLNPMPPKTDLNAKVTGYLDHPEFTVEKVQFQSRPGLYVTGNLYLPKRGLSGVARSQGAQDGPLPSRNGAPPAPAVLYVCGHSVVKSKDGKISYGNKAGYQHHGAWFARNGYVCLVVDTLQLGEIEGIHHGTYREKMWWWHSRGYSPAGVETWNNIRALDYLASRPEVDKERMGVTGRSGGGAYSWFLGAMDDRIKVAVPVAGITDLRDHVVDGAIEGHCDCMYMFNTYRWDFPLLSALMAPRALLLANTDKDGIFPLDGVYRIHEQNELLYSKLGAGQKNLGIVITEGGHKDTQEIQIPAFKWFNRHMKGDESAVSLMASRMFDSEQLRVFDQLPADQINAKIQEQFVAAAPAPKIPASTEEWTKMRDGWMAGLKEKVFRGWPQEAGPVELKQVASQEQDGVVWTQYSFVSQPGVELSMTVWAMKGVAAPDQVVVNVLGEDDGLERMEINAKNPAVVIVSPRGMPAKEEKKRTQILRRYALIGQTYEGMQAWDVRRALAAIRKLPIGSSEKTKIVVRATGPTAGVALYAALFEPVGRLELRDLPSSHMKGPQLLNVLRIMDVPAAVAMAAEKGEVVVETGEGDAFKYPQDVAKALGWADKVKVQRRSAAGQ
jgi:dienelactone hydrolase